MAEFLPSTLGKLALTEWEFPAHVQAMERNAMDLISDAMHNRAIIKIPVRHGKSFYHSYLLPAWFACKYPNRNCAVVSYSDEFAMEWSRKTRNMVQEWGPKTTGVQVDPKHRSAHHFGMKPPHTGEMRGIGINGSLAGKGFHLIVVDDPSKEFSELATEQGRNTLFNQFQGELLNRLEPGGKILIVQSSRHPDDISERLLRMNPELGPADQWREIKFPALSPEGVALWPERYPAEKLQAIRADYFNAGNAHMWHSLFQQEPEAASEATEWPASYWKDLFYTEKPNFKPKHRLLAIDAAAGKHRKTGDFGCILYADVDSSGTFWVEAQMVRLPITEFEALAAKTIRQRAPDGYFVEIAGEQGDLLHHLPTEFVTLFTATENPEVAIRMALTPLLHARKLRIKDTPHGRIVANQLRDFPLGPHMSGPHALMLLIQLRDALATPADTEDTFSAVSTT